MPCQRCQPAIRCRLAAVLLTTWAFSPPTCSHIATEAGDLDMLKLLIERGALLDLRDVSGSTPLHLALEAQVGGFDGLWLWHCCRCVCMPRLSLLVVV